MIGSIKVGNVIVLYVPAFNFDGPPKSGVSNLRITKSSRDHLLDTGPPFISLRVGMTKPPKKYP